MGINLTAKKDYKIRPYGDLDDLKTLFKDSSGDVIKGFDGKDQSFDEEMFVKATTKDNDKKRLDVTKLYGSAKPMGALPVRENVLKLRFSHNRVFGEKHRKLEEEKRRKEAENVIVSP